MSITKKSGTKSEIYLGYVLMYGFYYFAIALFSVLISIYMMGKGMNATQFSLSISAASIVTTVIQPVIGFWQDRGNKRNITIILLCISAATGLTFMFQNHFIGLMLFYSSTMALLNSANPYIEKLATVSRFSYGSIRIWGTIGYALGSQLAGTIYDVISPQSVYVFFAISILLAAIGILGTKKLPEIKNEVTTTEKTNYKKEVLGNKLFLGYLAISALFYSTTNLNSTYLPLLYQQAGLSVSATSTVLLVSTLMELPMILFASLYMNRLSNTKLLVMTFGSTILQFAIYAFVPLVEVQIIATVLLKATATMTYIMISFKVISSIVSQVYQMSALMLVSAFSKNMITVLMQVIGGYILEISSINNLFAVLAGLSLLGLLLTLIIQVPTKKDSATKF